MPQTGTTTGFDPTINPIPLITENSFKGALSAVSTYMTRKYKGTYTTTITSSDLLTYKEDAIPDLINQIYTSICNNNNNSLLLFDLIEITVTSGDNITFPLIILKIPGDNNNNVFVKLYIGEAYVSGICIDLDNSNRLFIFGSFMPLEDILYMLDNVNKMY